MLLHFLPNVKDYRDPDSYVRDVVLLPSESCRPGKLMELRRWAASLEVDSVMNLKRDELLLLISEKVGWEAISVKLSDVGVPRNAFLDLGLSKSEFEKLKGVDIKENGKYTYTLSGKRTSSILYSVYDYFKIKNRLCNQEKGAAGTAGM